MSNARTLASLIDGSNIVVPSGYGLDFSSTSDSSATGASLDTNGEILDEYEEGEYTAAITCGTGTITLKSTANTLEYVRIGRMVFVNGNLQVDSVSSPTGEPSLTLPFTSTSAGNYGRQGAGFVGISDLGTDAVNTPVTQIIGSASTVLMRDVGFSATPSFSLAGKIAADAIFYVSLVYKAN